MSCTVGELLDCANYNIKENGVIGSRIGRAQIKQYQELKAAGAEDDDDVGDALELYPECAIKLTL